jgi:hypothetical protein
MDLTIKHYELQMFSESYADVSWYASWYSMPEFVTLYKAMDYGMTDMWCIEGGITDVHIFAKMRSNVIIY